ncbi:phosphopantetheine-binding protein [Streptomyces sp. NPDC019224]|uniref:ATP-binding protein n=1 Tax=Streptomyces sp. NPDC019224 TaxID=3154484 RepID=UPI0033ECB0B5
MVKTPVTVPRSAPEGTRAQPGLPSEQAARTEAALAAVLADVIGRERVAVTSHFSRDLSAASLVMAHFCVRVRRHTGLPQVSIRDVYAHSTVREPALALTATTPPAAAPPHPVLTPSTAATAAPSGREGYVLCGAMQSLTFLVYSCLIAFAGVRGAVRYAPGPRAPTLTTTAHSLDITVTDTSCTPPAPRTPDPACGTGGLGLHLIDDMGARISTESVPGGKCVHAAFDDA